MAMGFTLTFVRHGETEMNKIGVLQGQGVNIGLNEDGRSQADCVGKYLSTEIYTHVYSSDLLRAKETCEIIMKENKSSRSLRENAVTLDTRLRERKFGVLEGKTPSDLAIAARKAGKFSDHDFCPDGAETMDDMQQRGLSFFRDLCDICYKYCKAKKRPPNVLVVSHGGFIYSVINGFMNELNCSFSRHQLPVYIGDNTARSCFGVTFNDDYKPSETCENDAGNAPSSNEQFKCKISMKCTFLNNCDHFM